MANVTVTTPLNHDDAAAAALLNGDDYIINGGALTINSDVRWGQNAAFPGNLSISATLGGSVLIDGRDVWWMAYDAPTGNVPSLGTQGVQNCTGGTSGATGEFLGIFTALGVAPSAAGGAMPTTGFIKFRSKVGTFVDNEVVTLPGGATLTVNSATGGQRGWIHIVGEEQQTITVPRLGLFQTRGDWFELGTTNGADDQTFQYPVLDCCPAIQIETAPGSGLYEWYINAGSRWGTATQYVATDARGKMFGQVNATGVITIARRASNPCGFKPATGLRVRIPNILISNSTTAAPTTNTITGTIANRWDFTTTSAGEIDIENTCGNWYILFNSAYKVKLKDSCALESIVIANTADLTTIDNYAVGINAAATPSPTVRIENLFSGGSITDFVVARYQTTTTANEYCLTFTNCVELVLTRITSYLFGTTTAGTRGASTDASIALTRVNDTAVNSCNFIGGRLLLEQCLRIEVNDSRYADSTALVTQTAAAQSAIQITNASSDIVIEGFANFGDVANVHPHLGICGIANSFDIEVKNIGTVSSPYNAGSTNAAGVIITSSVSKDLIFKRIYCDNLRTSSFAFTNTVQNVVCDNVWGDGADVQAIAALNINPRGQRYTNSTTGQTSVYGRHWEDIFTSTTTGRIVLAMNEALAATADQVQITAGTPKFTSAGNIVMPTLGDQVIWEMPYFAIGHTALANIAPTVTGTLPANMTLEYQIDLGSGYNGVWLALTGANLSSHTIPAFVNLYNQGGFKLKIRATTNTANATNALTYIRLDTVTTAIEQARQYPFFEPFVGYNGTQSGSNMAIYDSTTNERIRTAVDVSGVTSVRVPWDADYSAIKRLRKPGWAYVENAITVDFDGSVPDVTQVDYATIPDTDPGALGITVTNHGASPVTWNSKQFSITITTTNDALTAAQVANFINYYCSQLATFNGFSGLNWPEMVIPDGSNFQTARGRLIGSAGATLKGVRVVRSDGTTAVIGFSQMQADDGTYYVAPVVSNVSVTGFITGSRVFVKNVTTNTVLHNAIIVGTSYSDSYIDGTDYTSGDTFEVRITYVNGLTAKEPFRATGTVTSGGFSVSASQSDWTGYIDAGVDGSLVTECSTDYTNIQVDIDDPDNSTTKSRIAAFIVYAMHSEAQGIDEWFDVIEYRSAGSALIKSSVATVKIDNIKTGVALNVIDTFQLRMDDGSSLVDTSSNTIRWDNSAEVVVVETGTSGLTAGEAATLAKIDDLAADVETGYSPKEALRLILSATSGKVSGAETTTVVFRNITDNKNRITATVDAAGNRTSLTYDVGD